jgi:hypothetical protein
VKKSSIVLSLVGLSFWISGYFLPIDSKEANPNNLFSSFGWIGLLLFLSPYGLSLVLHHQGAKKTALSLSIILFMTLAAFFMLAVALGSYDPKSGDYRVIENLDQWQEKPGWLLMFIGISLLLMSTRFKNIRKNYNLNP